MINEKLIDVTYIAQPDERTCWKASYKMMLDYNSKADNLPNEASTTPRSLDAATHWGSAPAPTKVS